MSRPLPQAGHVPAADRLLLAACLAAVVASAAALAFLLALAL